MNPRQIQLLRDSLAALEGRTTEAADAFYRRLFHRLPELRAMFGNEAARRGKFANMLAVFGNAKYLDTLLPALQALGRRHGGYGALGGHFEPMGEALVAALAEVLGVRFTPETEYAWRVAYGEISEYLRQGLDQQDAPASPVPAGTAENLLERIGGREVLERVHRRFYRELFDDDWLGKFFWGKDLETLVMKQTDFMSACLGGPDRYRGETPAIAHMHMFITDEILDLRQAILRRAIEAEGLAPEVVEGWLRADNVFRPAVLKRSVDDCVMRCPGQMPIVAEKPRGYKSAKS
jgi:hemoglobin